MTKKLLFGSFFKKILLLKLIFFKKPILIIKERLNFNNIFNKKKQNFY